VRRGFTNLPQVAAPWRNAYSVLWRFMRSQRRFFIFHYAGFALVSAAINGCAAWYPAHMSRSFGWTAGRIGVSLGLTLGVASTVSQLLCGRAVSPMYRRGSRDAQLRWYAGCLIAATPFGILATTSANPWIFIGGLNVFIILLGSYAACTYSALNLVTPNEMRGSGVAFFSATAGLAGSGLGPILVAAISDHVFHNELDIGLAMAVVMGTLCPIAAGLLAFGLRPMRQAAADSEHALNAS
jgi:hypothetical protein